MLMTADEVLFNYGQLRGVNIKVDGITHTIAYVKTISINQLLQIQTVTGDIFPINRFELYEFEGIELPKELKANNIKKPRGKQKG